MVKSGLVDNPHVSQYRLTAHLIAATVIYVYMLWVALGLLRELRPDSKSLDTGSVMKVAVAVLSLVCLTLISGGFVAGLKAGLIFNTFPMMGDAWVPADMYGLSPWYLNWFENLVTVQFNHRVLAMFTFSCVISFWWFSRRSTLTSFARVMINLSALMALLQVAMGIGTLLLQVPVSLAVAHQGGALVLVTLLVLVCYELKRVKAVT